jgi:hypothetical protein
MPRQHNFRVHVISLVLLAAGCAAATAVAQSDSDFKIMDRARALYSTGPVPGSISCTAEVDWDGFFAKMKVPDTPESKARLATLKTIKISVTSRGAEHTDVSVDGPTTPAKTLTDGLRLQLQGFFQMYWSEAYGNLIAKRGDVFQLTTTPGGYAVNMTSGIGKVAVQMDSAFLITSFSLQSPQLSAVVTPQFKPGDDGLLRLRVVDETIDMGPSKLLVNVALDYQKAGIYDVPHHMSMGMPGSYNFDYTLTGCEAKAAASAPPAAQQP